MAWGHFLTIIAQLVIAGLLLFVGAAVGAGVRNALKGGDE